MAYILASRNAVVFPVQPSSRQLGDAGRKDARTPEKPYKRYRMPFINLYLLCSLINTRSLLVVKAGQRFPTEIFKEPEID